MIRFIMIAGVVAFCVNLATTQARLQILEWRLEALEAARPNTQTEQEP